jgi:hypothetical protein
MLFRWFQERGVWSLWRLWRDAVTVHHTARQRK